nr:class I SAM-dependent methyltransferase [Croceibacterium selenioxidans]
MRNARVLDFGCGSGASTSILARTYRDAEIVGVELDPMLVDLAKARADFYGLPNMKMLVSPSPDSLPEGIGTFDVVNLSAVLEHLLPNERKALLPMLWERLRPNGTLFIYETPHRFFPIETHTTGLPLINYLPSKLAHAVINVAGGPNWRGRTWTDMLRAGIRGGSIREVSKILGPGAQFLPPTRMGMQDRLQLWHAKASEGRRPQRSKDLVYSGLRALRTVTRIEMLPELSIAVRKVDLPT